MNFRVTMKSYIKTMYCKQKIVFTMVIYIHIVESILEPCNQLGTPCTIRAMDHRLANGTCVCHPHVMGQYCDACSPGYYGLWTGSGCLPCDRQCNSEGTLTVGNGLLHCDSLGRCSCKQGYYGVRCEEKLPTLAVTCEDCKPNCYKQKDKCKKCSHCYSLVRQKFDEYINGKGNHTVDHKTIYRDLENRIQELLSKIVDTPNIDLDDKLKKYYKEMDSIKKQLRDLTDYDNLFNLDVELNKKMELLEKMFSEIDHTKDKFRQKLQNLTTSTENTNLAKIVKDIVNAKDKAVEHVKDIQKIATETTQTCLETCQRYDKLDSSLKDNEIIQQKLQQKLLEWETLKANSREILRKFNDLCIDLNNIKIPHYEHEQIGKHIQELDEKLKLYKEADKLLERIKDINLDKILNAEKELNETLQDFDDFVQGKEKQLNELKSILKFIQQADFNFGEIEERLEKVKMVIRVYLEKNQKLLTSLKKFLSLANNDDELENIEREIDFLTQEYEYFIETILILQTRLNNARQKLDRKLKNLLDILENLRGLERKMKDFIHLNDFILKEIANKDSLDALEEEINEAYDLIEVQSEKMRINVDLTNLKDTKIKLDELTVNASEICGSITGDLE